MLTTPFIIYASIVVIFDIFLIRHIIKSGIIRKRKVTQYRVYNITRGGVLTPIK